MGKDKVYIVIKECVSQDNHERYYPGDKMINPSLFEFSRHMAEGNITPETKTDTKETRLVKPTEKRIAKPMSKPTTRKRGTASRR